MTKTDHTHDDDAFLADFFDASRAEAPLPSDSLMVRIMADADHTLDGRMNPARSTPKRTLWATLSGAIGGWPALASMATAAAAGVWFGAVSPDTLYTVSGGLLATDSAAYDLDEFAPGYAALVAFGDEVAQ